MIPLAEVNWEAIIHPTNTPIAAIAMVAVVGTAAVIGGIWLVVKKKERRGSPIKTRHGRQGLHRRRHRADTSSQADQRLSRPVRFLSDLFHYDINQIASRLDLVTIRDEQ